MNLNILKSFLLTSETKNLTKASELLNYSHSTVSTHIEKLEKQLDVKLFHRKKYGMELTEEGLAYIKYAKMILDSNSEYEREIRGLNNKKVNISINMQESQYLYRYYKKINEWLTKHSYVNLKFKSAHSNFYIKEEIANFKSDISLITDEKAINSNLTAIPITEERLVFVSNKKIHNFKLSDIPNHTLLVTEKGCSYREQLEMILYKYSFSTKQMIEFLGIESLKKYLKNSGGIALLPEFIIADELQNNSLYQIDIDVDIPKLKTTLVINPESNKQVLELFVKDIFL
ncbi:LysR family transcriptional regulator [Staphylococcus epidermidis]|uniref:LysR family transcriptional regulator n=1 Tax=Staphylococcus epidermidis TaxID=1282 RepID=UPI001D5DB04B|nr:LysR family transcriptional regulator [Staphylococcus epidermidis]MBM6371313.1 LysR family transcriptional regulator [Staphylococcus epidermidis]MCG2107694.1 LysR family transcriptional regulator [Staphylococcus epidermidis]MCO6331331.1 LysR family transcriptional regulator [Staphylococcus epidermidis]UTF16802.1 LysR family transcriptional regulator [Staphylococcus epidermidis]UXS06834.1 LysR family transcriptional regulator [Staphylococcus epidermidis]